MDSNQIESTGFNADYSENSIVTSIPNNDEELDEKRVNDGIKNATLPQSYVCDDNDLEVNIHLKIAIRIQNVIFEFNKNNKIITNLSIQIPEGKIYALLGSNGSGKTTLLRLVLGRLKPKSGSIRVFGVEPGSERSQIPGSGVGYMPQDIALFNELTIEETLTYFGIIYHMKSDDIQYRIKHLAELLNFPEINRKICELSGGQQRLVSIAVTMIHRPKLLILDEPTVGVDSLLRCRIWQYLENICEKDGITVIITTHYIEEAKTASTVGFIRSGKLLTQSNPHELLEKHNSSTLEDVFFKLSQKQDLEKYASKQIFKRKETEEKKSNIFKNKSQIDFERMRALLWKSYIRTKRNPIILFLFILLPVIQISLFCVGTGKRPQNIAVSIHNPELNNNLSLLFIDKIDRKMIHKIYCDSKESAIDSVRKGKTNYAITFAQNFSECFEMRVEDLQDLTDEELECSEIKLFADMSNSVIGPYIHRSLVDSFQDFIQTYSISLGYNKFTFSLPLNIEQPIYGTKESSIDEFMAPGVIIAYIHVTTMLISAFLIVLERKDGHLDRSLVAGVKTIEILFSHIIMLFIGLLIQVPLLMIFSCVIFEIPLRGSVLEAFGLIFLQGLQGMSFGLLISVIVPNEALALLSVYSIALPMWLFSGVFWPLEAMPKLVGVLTNYCPITLPIDALRSVMLRGWSVQNIQILFGYSFSLFYTLIAFIITNMLFKKTTQT